MNTNERFRRTHYLGKLCDTLFDVVDFIQFHEFVIINLAYCCFLLLFPGRTNFTSFYLMPVHQ